MQEERKGLLLDLVIKWFEPEGVHIVLDYDSWTTISHKSPPIHKEVIRSMISIQVRCESIAKGESLISEFYRRSYRRSDIFSGLQSMGVFHKST